MPRVYRAFVLSKRRGFTTRAAYIVLAEFLSDYVLWKSRETHRANRWYVFDQRLESKPTEAGIFRTVGFAFLLPVAFFVVCAGSARRRGAVVDKGRTTGFFKLLLAARNMFQGLEPIIILHSDWKLLSPPPL